MKPVECEYEPEVLAAALESRWPDGVEGELREHAAGCAICSDLLAVAQTMEEARDEMRAQASVPDSGRVWRTAQMRARREAAKTAGRPITAAQVMAFACAAGLLGACFGATSTWFQAALKRLGSAVAELDLTPLVPSASALIAQHGFLILVGAAVLLLIPAAVYLTILRD